MKKIKIVNAMGREFLGTLDHLTGIVYLTVDEKVKVETVQNLVSNQFELFISEIPKEAEILNFSNMT